MVLTFSTLGAGSSAVARDGEEAGGVVRRVLDIGGQHVEAVDFTSKARGDGGDRLVAAFGDLAGGAGGIAAIDGGEVVLGDELAALAERH